MNRLSLLATLAILIFPGASASPDSPCERFYQVQKGDQCASIEASLGLAKGHLEDLNPGLSCLDLAPQTNVCVKSPKPESSTTTMPSFPVLTPPVVAFRSPFLANVSAASEDRMDFLINTVFQSDSQQLAAFTQSDLNKDGKLDRTELQKMMSMNSSVTEENGQIDGMPNAEELVSAVLRASDLNNDGSIDKEEFMMAVRQMRNASNSMASAASDRTMGKVLKRDEECFTVWRAIKKRWWYPFNPISGVLIGLVMDKSCSEEGPKAPSDISRSDPILRCGSQGCETTCSKFSTDTCACGHEYEIERQTEYADAPYSTTSERSINDCQSRCSDSNDCVGFSIAYQATKQPTRCNLYKTLKNKKRSDMYTTYRMRTPGRPTDTPRADGTCPSVCGTEFIPWAASKMAADYAFGEKLTNEHDPPKSKKRAAQDSVDRRGDPNFTTTMKSQHITACGLCAPYSFTTVVEGTHKVWKQGYRHTQDLSPIWVGLCKGKQSCEPKLQGGSHRNLITAVGDLGIHLEKCTPQSTVRQPVCNVNCGTHTDKLPYITSTREWSFHLLGPEDKKTREMYIEEMKTWLRDTGPIMGAICVNESWDAYVALLESSQSDITFYNGDERWDKGKRCGSCNHAISIIGYKYEERRGRNRLVWIIQNSYGRGYGRGGYQLIEHGSAAIWTWPFFGVKVGERPVNDNL